MAAVQPEERGRVRSEAKGYCTPATTKNGSAYWHQRRRPGVTSYLSRGSGSMRGEFLQRVSLSHEYCWWKKHHAMSMLKLFGAWLRLQRDGGSTAFIALQRRINEAFASKVTTVGPARLRLALLDFTPTCSYCAGTPSDGVLVTTSTVPNLGPPEGWRTPTIHSVQDHPRSIE